MLGNPILKEKRTYIGFNYLGLIVKFMWWHKLIQVDIVKLGLMTIS